jgi:hypothetical protein
VCGFAALFLASSKGLLDPPVVCDDHRSPLKTLAAMSRKVPILIRIFIWLAALAAFGMCLSILLAIYDIGPHIMGGERVTRNEWLHIAAPLVAVIILRTRWRSCSRAQRLRLKD